MFNDYSLIDMLHEMEKQIQEERQYEKIKKKGKKGKVRKNWENENTIWQDKKRRRG